MYEVRFAKQEDLDFCIQRDFSIKTRQELTKKLDDQELIIASKSKYPIGYLRWEKLWGKIPYMSVINVVDKFQGIGIGTQMLHYLEGFIKTTSPVLLTSAEHIAPKAFAWHKRNGFKECGYIDGLNPNGVREIFLIKMLKNGTF